MDRISAYVYDESNVYNEAWARRLDIELNIRDNQATALEVAMYVRGEFAEDKQPLTDAQVTAAGIAREGKIGSIGYRIGRNACESVMDALRNKVIEDTDALAIADFCPGNESVQGKGLKVILDGGSKTEARARMEAELAKQKMAREVGVEGGTDLFGNTLEDEAFWDFVAKYVVGRRNELAKDALFLRTNVGKRNSSAMTKKYGVDLKDPESLKKALKEIDMLRERWKNPYVEADLMEEIKQAWQERQEGEVKPAAQVFERYAQRLRERERGVTDYSVSPTLKEDLHEAFENRYGEDKDLPLCDSPRLFRVLGIVPAPIVTRQRIVRKLRLAHKLSEEQIAEAVLRFDDPLGVIVENRNAVIVLPGMLARNKAGKDSDMMSAIRLQRAKNGEHFMASLYPLDNLQKIEDQLRQGNLRYCKYNAKALANVSSNASGGTMTPALVRLLIHQGFNENTIIGSENVKGGNSISVTQAQERGMFKDGVMEVSNGVIVAPDTDYSVDFSHASYELFRKPDKKHVGKGEGVQVFGWACIYGAESWDTNKFYHGQFTQKVRGGFSLNGKVVSERAVLKQLNKETGKEYLLKFLNGAFRSNADEYRQLIEENRGWIEEDKERLAEAERGYIDGKKRSEAEIKEEKARLESAIKNRTSKLEAYEWLAKNEVHKVEDSVRYPVNYLIRADVDDSNLLHWDVPEFVGRDLSSPDIGGAYYGREMVEKILGLDMKEPTEDLVRALWNMMKQPEVPEEGYVAFKESVNIEPIEYEFSSKEFDAADYDMETLLYWGEYIANVCMTGKEVYNALARSLGSPRAASEWLDEHGVRGVKYYDGNTRHKEGEKVHNYAIFNPDYIEVIAINNRHAWSEYSEGNPDWQRPEEVFGDGVTDYSVIGESALTWEKYKKRAFKGRDDGKMRAELDASKAKVKKKGWAMYKAAAYEEKDFCTLGELLSFPELYAAYPWLKGVAIDRMKKGVKSSGALMPPLDMAVVKRIKLGEKETEEELRRTLLHEAQHLIQQVEHFAAGAGNDNMVRMVMRELGRENELPPEEELNPEDFDAYIRRFTQFGTLYHRAAGEIEARNVAKRADMTAYQRRIIPFNRTLDISAEKAIAHDINDYYYARRWNKIRNDALNENSGAKPVTDYSVAGMKARTAGANMDRVYRDPADGKEKFVIPTANARLSTGFTLGQLRAPVGGHKDASLGAILEYPELYEAYPELKGMRVRLYNPRLQEGVGGFFARPRGEKAGYLALNTGVEVTPERVMETLLHESQHAIQAIEGHAMGAGSMNAEEALEYLDRAIAARKGIMKAAGDDAWSRENLAYLEAMRGMVQGKEGRKMQEMAISQVYWYSHGEQEARFTGAGKDGDPMAEGSGLTENSPTTYTIAVPGEATELGGVTFGGMGRFSYLLESRLGTAGEFNYDRAVYQMKEAVVRRMKELRMLGDSKDERARGVQLAAEALATMESLESLLPATYRFGLEAYKVYFSSYAKLAGSGSAAAAGRMVPMAGWGERMRGAYEKMAWMAVEGHFYKGDMEFWGEHWKKVERILPPLQEKWEELQKMYVGGLLRGKARQDAINAAWRELRHELPEEMRTLMQAVGEVRADKLMAKFMERVALQLDAFRKDKTLGRIRRVVGALKPGAKENGKPVKGRMDAERYRKMVDMVRLMELTRGERELFERERYTGEGTEKAWADLEPNDTVTVRTYDGEGKEVEIVCSKEEFETYACFETMTASQAEAASRALGELISTGRQAWDNAQEAARKRIEALCAPALERYGETENELKARRERQQRKVMPLVNKTLNFLGFGLNDAQFFDVCSKVPEIEKWTKDAVYRIASAHTYIEAKERDRQEFMTRAAREASGEKDDKKVREWLDDTRRNRDTGIKLAPQEPDFDAQETETVRRQFMGLLRRKTHKKNFNPNTFAEALRYLTEEDGLMPEAVAREALDKYGTLGDAKASRLHGKEALMSVLTDNEYARFSDLTMTAAKRAEAAREKWQKEREQEAAKRKEDGKPKEVADPFSKSFAQRVIAAFSGQKQPKKKDIFTLCKYPVLLQQLKPWGGNVHINWENMYKLSKKHNLTPEQIARLPQEINNPIAVIEDRDGSLLVVTDIDAPTKKSVQENRDGLRKDIIKRKTIAVLRLGRSSKTGAEIVDLITAYSHDTSAKQVGLLREKRLLYLDKERSGNWTSKEEDSIPPLLKTLLEESGSTIMVKEASPDVKQNNDDETLVLSDKNKCTERGKSGQEIYRLDKNSVPQCLYGKHRQRPRRYCKHHRSMQ